MQTTFPRKERYAAWKQLCNLYVLQRISHLFFFSPTRSIYKNVMSADVIFSKRCCHTAYSKLSRFDILAVHMRNALMVRELHLPQPSRETLRFFLLFFFLVSFSLAFWDSPRYRLFSEIDPRHAEYFCNWTAVSDVYFQRSKRGMCKRRLCKLTRGIATLCTAVTDHGAGISLCTCDWLAPWQTWPI